jgi:hypothetical protein
MDKRMKNKRGTGMSLKKVWIGCWLTMAGCLLAAGEFPAGTEILPGGQFTFAGQSFGIIHFNLEWTPETQSIAAIKSAPGYPVKKAGEFQLRGKLTRGFDIEEQITATDSGAIRYSCRLGSAAGVPTNELSLFTHLSVDNFAGQKIFCDGKEILLPKQFDEKAASNLIFNAAGVKKISLPVENGLLNIEGNFKVLLQDDRKYSAEQFSLRIRFDGDNCPGSVNAASLQLAMSLSGYKSLPLDIAAQANMGFADEVAGDRKGGWTDQGPENDLRMFKPGQYNFCGIAFNIIDPAGNGGNACIVLKGPSNPVLPKTATIPGNGLQGSCLYLLHATGWTPAGKEEIGQAVVNYADGTQTILPVRTMEEVGNWWGPVPLPNGLVAWQSENQSANVGLYLSKFKIERKPVRTITLKSAEKCLWLITAVTLTPEEVILPKEIVRPLTIVQNAEWQPFTYDRDIITGSIMDFSPLLDAPAGKHGPLIIKDGKFVFADTPDQRIKFYGANLAFTANFLDKAVCEQLAERLAKMGYNSVRFHHFDALLTKPDGKNGVVLAQDKINQLDYLFHCLKKRGIYLTIDLYTIRQLAKGEIKDFPELAIGMEQFKGLAFVNDSVMANWEDFSRKLLTHVNPYTGLAWKDDPALISISLINENTIFSVTGQNPVVVQVYDRLFNAWLQDKKLNSASAEEKAALKKRFLSEVYNRAYAGMSQFLRGLGVKQPLTDQNMWSTVNMSLMRQHYDYVDNHGYWDHPNFPVNRWRMPFGFSNKSDIGKFAAMPLFDGPSRLFGKPMMFTEFDFVSSNQYRAEGGLVMGAYSALQDWDGIYRFAYSHGEVAKPEAAYLFDVFSSPSSAISEKMGVLCFLRGDVKRAEACFPTLIPENYQSSTAVPDNYPSAICRLGLIGRIGTIVLPAAGGDLRLPQGTVAVNGMGKMLNSISPGVPYFSAWPAKNMLGDMLQAGIIEQHEADLAKGIFRSSTGELELNQPEGTFNVITERSEGAVLPAGKTLTGKVLKITGNTAYAAFFAAALDGNTLSGSNRILLLHLTDIQNSKAKFSSAAMTLWIERGSLPHLLRKGEAKISLKGNFADHKLYAVNLAGKRLAEVPLVKTADGVCFKADTHMLKNGVVAYELTH